ncbi:hypothetical protein [Nocardia sp. NBC_00511]|uniref:hypothetical protein n=1 Tax=Nocardia sp. NBC_00511 TaxID=2903591 RepID=UPI0030E492AF
MSWQTWALIALIGLCVVVTIWGFSGRERGDARFLRLTYLDGEHCLYVPASGAVGRWHRGQHRAA